MRFPEFTGEWRQDLMENVTERIGDGIHSTPTYNEYGDYFFINGNNLVDGKIKIFNNTQKVTKEEALKQNANVLCDNSLLLSINGTIGNVAIYNNERIMLGKSACYINPSAKILRDFLFFYLQNSKIQKYFILELTGSTIKNLSLTSIKNTKLRLPSNQEQAKIAKLLRAIDERIATQNKIIEKLQSLIKGLPHKAAETGLINGSWEKAPLSTVLVERKELNAALHTVHSVSVSEGVINQIDYLGRSFAAKDTSNYHVARKGDIIYTKSPTGDFPFGIVKQSYIDKPVAISPLYGVYSPISFELGVYLHNYFLSAISTINYLYPLVQKGAKNTINISNQRFLENRIPLPTNLADIHNLAKALTAIQRKLNIEQRTLASLSKQKQYLLQQMFI